MTLQRILNRQSSVFVGCLVTFAIGLIFIFIRQPHPWGWTGIDRYDELALDLARGRGFPTLEVPWGYALFVAGFYRAFGHHLWPPLVAQAALNAFLPLLVFLFARDWLDRPTAILAALLTAVLSFNTVYASTLASDSVCTVVFMLALVAFVTARRRDSAAWYGITGLLIGIAAQFRPNLLLVPLVLAGFALMTQQGRRRASRRVLHAAAIVICAALALAPWTIRNYRLTRTVLPTSVHGGAQLWYGSLQIGPYLNSRAYNPRSFFEAPVFDYTPLGGLPVEITAYLARCSRMGETRTALVYWSDVNAARRRVEPREGASATGQLTFDLPPPDGVVTYYYFETIAVRPSADPAEETTPEYGAAAPLVFFVSQQHLRDLDVHGDLLDVFDLVRMVRYVTWHEALPFKSRLAAAGIGSGDVERAAEILIRVVTAHQTTPVVAGIDADAATARLRFVDGSTIVIPRTWNHLITDLSVSGGLALTIVPAHVSLAALALERSQPPDHALEDQRCTLIDDVGLNRIFYRNEPAMMQRYLALAADNIRRNPISFAIASLYRAVRVFVVVGANDRYTAQQFSRSRMVYLAATIASAAYLLLFVAGVAIAWRRRAGSFALPLSLILYVPVTIGAVLTNMRYSVTIQPLIFMFVALALVSALERVGWLPLPNGNAPGRP